MLLTGDNGVKVSSLPPHVEPTEAGGILPFLPITVVANTPTAVPPTATPVPTLAPEPTATELPVQPTIKPIDSIVPARLRIPVIGIDADVEHVGKTKDGAMDVPKSYWTVGWYKLGFKPGELGNSVIDGHVDNPKGPSIFWDLKKLQAGNKVYISDNQGKELTFEVIKLEKYSYDGAPLDKIFGSADDVYLNLITCSGTFDQSTHNYDQRLVVFTKLTTQS
jgi:LPXTG-site transpeptidase (sortase) family protein